MINFIEERFSIGEKNISVASDYENLNTLAEEGLIEKREGAGGKTYYYVEATDDDMRFGVFIRLREKRIERLLLRWLDRPIKGWEDVSEKAMIDEYRLLSNFVKNKMRVPPDSTRTGTRTWRVKWGKIDLSYEVRSFDVAIIMKPS